MNIIITGSIAYDYLMRFPGRFTDHLIGEQLHQISLSFLVDDMTKHWGGVAANIAFNTAMLGLRTHLMGTTGRDFPDYRRWLDNVGVDTSTVRQIDEVFTASFFVNTDLDNNQIASFYTGAMAYAKNYSIADVYEGQPDLVVISPNDPDAMIEGIERAVALTGNKTTMLFAQHARAMSLVPDLPGAIALLDEAIAPLEAAENLSPSSERLLGRIRALRADYAALLATGESLEGADPP